MRLLVLLLLLISSPLHAATYYVDVATGSNGDAGTSEADAWADPGYAAQQMGDGDICYVKSGTYTVTTTTPGAAGPVKFAQASLRARMEGYSTTPGDRCIGGSKPLISADASLNPGATCYLVEGVGAINEPHVFVALSVDANSEPSTTCFKGSTGVYPTHFIDCEAREAAADGFLNGHCFRCYAASNGGDGFDTVVSTLCYAESNTGGGFVNLSTSATGCIARANGGAGFASFTANYINCVAYGNTGAGFNAHRNNMFINCVAVSNTTYGFNTGDHSLLDTCASYGNTTARTNTTPMFDYDAVTLSGDPFVDAANDDFTPDSTANEGALLRAAGIGPYGQTSFIDIGAVQHEDSGGGGNVVDPLSGSIPGL